jgi:hypothetical protein
MPEDTASILAELAILQRATQPVSAAPTEPNQQMLDGKTPTISLAGKDWPIPLLAPRQNRIVVPAVSKITRRMREIGTEKLAELDAESRQILLDSCDDDLVARLGADGAVRQRLWQITDFSKALVEQMEPDFFDLLDEAAYWALTRAHPSLTRAEFDDMPIGTIELIDAIGNIAQQTGMMRKVDPSVAPLATADQNPALPTGTP